MLNALKIVLSAYLFILNFNMQNQKHSKERIQIFQNTGLVENLEWDCEGDLHVLSSSKISTAPMQGVSSSEWLIP